METTCRLCADIGNSFINIFDGETSVRLKHLIFETTTIHVNCKHSFFYINNYYKLLEMLFLNCRYKKQTSCRM